MSQNDTPAPQAHVKWSLYLILPVEAPSAPDDFRLDLDFIGGPAGILGGEVQRKSLEIRYNFSVVTGCIRLGVKLRHQSHIVVTHQRLPSSRCRPLTADTSQVGQGHLSVNPALQANVRVTDEMVVSGLQHYSEGGGSRLADYERRAVVRAILEAALAANQQEGRE